MNRLVVVGIVLLLTVSISKTQEFEDIEIEVLEEEDEEAVDTTDSGQIQTPLGALNVGLLGRIAAAGLAGGLGPDMIRGALSGFCPGTIVAGAAIGVASGGLSAMAEEN